MSTPAPAVYAPTSRYRQGVRDDAEARAAHNEQTREWRRDIAETLFDPDDQEAFLAALVKVGEPIVAAEQVGVAVNRVYGRMRWDADWAARVEAVLAELCAEREHCGSARGYRDGGRCAACRAAKERDRGPHRGGPHPLSSQPSAVEQVIRRVGGKLP